MNPISSGARNIALALALALALGSALSGCVVTATPYGVYAGPGIAVAPPAVQVETYGPAPYPGYFWVGGYWNWVGGRYVWVGGHWQAPRPGYRWVPHAWVRGADGWHMRPGRWVRR